MTAALVLRVRDRAGTAVDRLTDFMTAAPRALTAVALLRAAVGLCGLGLYLGDYRLRHLLFGPGVLETAETAADRVAMTGTGTLYALARTPASFDLLYHLGVLAAVLVLLGVGGRVVLALHYVLIWSLYAVNPLVLDGGDNLIMILGLVLLLTRCYDRLSFRLRAPRRVRTLATVAHNTALLVMAGQVCVVYLMAGLYKVQGRLWQDGTALYYVLRVPEFYWPGVTEHLFRLEWFLVIGAYATVWMSIYFPLLVAVRRTRLLAVLMMGGFHVSIGLLMGLTSFAVIMIACDLLFVNAHVERVVRLARSALGALGRRARDALGRPAVASGPEVAARSALPTTHPPTGGALP